MTSLHFDATADELRVLQAENEDLLQAFDGYLIQLEQDGLSAALVQDMFRVAHTIKGSAASVGHIRMAQLTHAVESLLDRLRKGESDVTAPLLDCLFAALDVMKVLATEIQTGESVEADVDAHVRALEAWDAPLQHASMDPFRLVPPVPAQPNGDFAGIRPSTLAKPAGATHHILVQFDAGPWAAVRAFQTLLALSSVAEVLISRPTRAEVEAEQVNRRLEAWLRTDRLKDDIRKAVSDVFETTILSLDRLDLEQESPEERTSPPAPAAIPGPPAAGPDEAPASLVIPATDHLPQAPRNPTARPTATTVRIDVERLDALVNLVGELVIDRTRLLDLGRRLAAQVGDSRLLRDLNETALHLGRVTDELQAEVMKSRMLPISTVFGRLPRLVRDLAARQRKHVSLIVEGQDTEVDRSVIEEIGDPLIHLIRNAVDHGVESPEQRIAAGKPMTATIRLVAEHADNSIVVTVEDDGTGIDGDRVRRRAVERGLMTAEAASHLSNAQSVELIFASGLSTAVDVTDVSGRGVGLDIVRANVERLGGAVEVSTEVGRGSRFTLRLPLTLAILQALLVRVAGSIYALPLTSVTETLRMRRQDVQRIHGQEAVLLRGNVLPVIRLVSFFGAESASGDPVVDELGRPGENRFVWIVAVRIGDRHIGLAVDALLGEQEVVIKALGPLVGIIPGISSAAILGDGTVALIVDVPGLVQCIAEGRRGGKSHAHRSSQLVQPETA